MRLILVVAALLCAPLACAQSREQDARDFACPAARRAEVQLRLEDIRTEDQADRSSMTMREGALQRDLARRQEVAALFAEGCFSTGRDYHNAALVFQHGAVPEHYYQAWLFARRAVELGDAEAQWLVPRAIDRYLMNLGYKQIFATNLVTDAWFGDEGARGVWCVWPSVSDVNDAERIAVGGVAVTAQIERARQMNEAHDGEGGLCAVDAQEPPRGLFPGMW